MEGLQDEDNCRRQRLVQDQEAELVEAEPTTGFEPGTPSLRVNRICPEESPVGLSRQELSVHSTLEGTRAPNPMRPIFRVRHVGSTPARRCRFRGITRPPSGALIERPRQA